MTRPRNRRRSAIVENWTDDPDNVTDIDLNDQRDALADRLYRAAFRCVTSLADDLPMWPIWRRAASEVLRITGASSSA